jgi:MerR family transcriptional regulator, heat shock protein HspR
MASMSSQPQSRQSNGVTDRRFQQDPSRPCFVISVAAGLVQAHPRTLRIYEDEGLLAPARTPTNIRLYSENDIRRILWIRRLTQERGVNLAGVRLLFELEERLGTRILEALFDEVQAREAGAAAAALQARDGDETSETNHRAAEAVPQWGGPDGPEPAQTGGQTAGQVAEPGYPAARPITRIVATRVTTTRSGESND